MRFALKDSRLGLRNSTTRIPFRYGNACLWKCPQAILQVTIEAAGRVREGYAGDCLPPAWFDKTPGRSFKAQIDDMLAVAAMAQDAFREAASSEVDLFSAWLGAYEGVHERARALGLNELLASFGASLVERALMDALARAAGLSFALAVRSDLYGIDPGRIHPGLSGLRPADWLPAEPRRWVFVRHTVGLGDPLTAGEIPADQRVDDGLPQALEEYVEGVGLRYFKVKLANDLDRDRARLLAFAEVVERHRGPDYRLTLDGNEQYKNAGDFAALMEMLRGTPRLRMLLENTIAIEQPLDRAIALDGDHTELVLRLGHLKPVIIDESDATLMSYPRALDLGYRGVSSKNCKGPIKSLLNAGLTWIRNGGGRQSECLMTGEDLCSVGIVPTQADLCLVATLGLDHVERNGHHYHPGLSYLPEVQRRAALQAHPDFYAERGSIVGPCVRDGRFAIGSLQCEGFGFAVEPIMDAMESPGSWRYESLGLGD
jgi:hypothetical protein